MTGKVVVKIVDRRGYKPYDRRRRCPLSEEQPIRMPMKSFRTVIVLSSGLRKIVFEIRAGRVVCF